MSTRTLSQQATLKRVGDKGYIDGASGTTIANPLGGVPITDNLFASAASATQATTGTARKAVTVGIAATDLRVAFSNSYVNSSTFVDTPGSDGLVLRFALEIASVVYPMTFNGSRSVTVDGGGLAVSDPLPVEVAAGQVINTRTFVVSGTWHSNSYSGNISGGGGWVVTTDLTAAGSGAVADSNSNLITPSAILGRPTAGGPSVVIAGDSIAHGQGDASTSGGFIGRNANNTRLGGGGYIARGLYGKAGYATLAYQGDQTAVFATAAGHSRRGAFIPSGSTFVCEYGRNDLGGKTLAQMQALYLTIWQYGAQRGRRVIQTTITPVSTSTDGFLTTGAQTVSATNTVRVALNDWLRAGAPIDPASLAAVAVGTTGALLAGQSGHPLYGIWDACDIVETARNSGLWKAAVNTRSVADAATTASNNTVTSATAAFTSADIGRQITIAGAGFSGNLHTQCVINQIVSATQVQVSLNPFTTVSGAAMTIGDFYTLEGTHPSIWAHTAMAAAIDTSMLA